MKLTQKVLDDVARDLQAAAAEPPIYNEKGEPCYSMYFVGTVEEWEAVQKKMAQSASANSSE